MKKKHRGFVETQEMKDIAGGTDAYERFVERQPDSQSIEDVRANPDSLPEQSSSPSTPQMLMGEAVNHLQGRQREVYILVMREDKSMAEAGEVLGIGKSTVQTYLDRAIDFISEYCKQAISKDRV